MVARWDADANWFTFSQLNSLVVTKGLSRCFTYVWNSSNHFAYLCQWAPAACLGFLLVAFGTVGALTSFEFSESATFKYQTGRKIRNPRTPSTMRACSFFSNLLLEFCFLTPTFSSAILLHKFVQVFNTMKIPDPCFGTRDTLKKVICLILSYAIFLLLCYFHMNLNTQHSWPHWSSTYRWQFSTGNRFHGKD